MHKIKFKINCKTFLKFSFYIKCHQETSEGSGNPWHKSFKISAFFLNTLLFYGNAHSSLYQGIFLICFQPIFFSFLFFLVLILYWSIVDLQYSVSFRCTAKRFSLHIHISILFHFLFPYRLLQNTE